MYQFLLILFHILRRFARKYLVFNVPPLILSLVPARPQYPALHYPSPHEDPHAGRLEPNGVAVEVAFGKIEHHHQFLNVAVIHTDELSDVGVSLHAVVTRRSRAREHDRLEGHKRGTIVAGLAVGDVDVGGGSVVRTTG